MTLTPRETQVLTLIAQGKTNKEVAWELGLSVRTVETHRTHVRRKTNTGTPIELLRLAVGLRLVHL